MLRRCVAKHVLSSKGAMGRALGPLSRAFWGSSATGQPADVAVIGGGIVGAALACALGIAFKLLYPAVA